MEERKVSAQPTPQEVLRDALTRYEPDRIAISFSGAEDVVLIDMAYRLGMAVDVFSLDTGRLHPETYRYLEMVSAHYGFTLQLLMPDPRAVTELVAEKGLFSFFRDGHSECCAVRKIEPLRRKLASLDAWITGQRRDQNVTRGDVLHEHVDRAFSTEERPLTKFNPLANWTSGDVWAYIRANQVPYNELHDRGFLSIGCEPCTRPIGPHAHERAGRWWWEDPAQKECGLHPADIVKIVK